MNLTPFVTRAVICALVTAFSVADAFASVKFQATTQAEGNKETEFDVFLPLTHQSELDALLQAQQTPGSSQYHKWLTPEQFTERFGPDKNQIAKISQLLEGYGLHVVRTHSHGIRVRGQARGIERTFSTSLWEGVGPHGSHQLIAKERLYMPDLLQQAGAIVTAFSPAIRNHVHSRNLGKIRSAALNPANRDSVTGAYWTTDLKQAYNFPSHKVLTGKGIKIGVLMSSDYSEDDLNKYFGHEKLTPPTVIRRPLLGGAGYDPSSEDSLEAALDIQQAGGMAPGAVIYLYSIPDLSDDSAINGFLSIVQSNEVDIVNSSFGEFELSYSADYNYGISYVSFLGVYNDIFKQGNAEGITFVASSGDQGALPTPPVATLTADPTDPPSVVGYFLPGVSSPASSPYVTAVGGTNLLTSYDPGGGSRDSRYIGENAYGDPLMPVDLYGTGNLVAGGYWGSGGGISQYFLKPDYQSLVGTGSTQFRTVPDVALHMGGCPADVSYPCPPDRSADVVALGGDFYDVIGTSASSPDFAGLLALREELVPGRMGNANYFIYNRAHEQFYANKPVRYFHSGVVGFNGYYQPHYGYNLVIGNGTVSGRDFIGASSLPGAGEPGAPSNP